MALPDVERQKHTCGENARNANPSYPTDATKRLDAAQTETYKRSDSNKNSRACSMRRNCIKTNRDAQHRRTCNEDPVFKTFSNYIFSTRAFDLQSTNAAAHTSRPIRPNIS